GWTALSQEDFAGEESNLWINRRAYGDPYIDWSRTARLAQSTYMFKEISRVELDELSAGFSSFIYDILKRARQEFVPPSQQPGCQLSSQSTSVGQEPRASYVNEDTALPLRTLKDRGEQLTVPDSSPAGSGPFPDIATSSTDPGSQKPPLVR